MHPFIAARNTEWSEGNGNRTEETKNKNKTNASKIASFPRIMDNLLSQHGTPNRARENGKQTEHKRRNTQNKTLQK
jgi:hypothetical protein